MWWPAVTAQAQFALLRELTGASDGSQPFGSLTLDGSMLYGMTLYGGSANLGTVFKMNKNGTGFVSLRQFAGTGSGDGSYPHGTLTVSGPTIYGMTENGGSADYGTVFKINTDGTGFTLLRQFAGGVNDGGYPYGSLTVSGSTIYGMTRFGGDTDLGTIFKMNDDGTGFTLLREFVGGGADGSWPYGSLLLSGSTLYGMTRFGGDNESGTIFKMNDDGTGFSLLHEFAGGVNNGSQPYGSLLLSGSTLYGMTSAGGDTDLGTVFRINTDGSGFSLLHEFASGGADGSQPFGSLTLSGSTLYGMTLAGGDYDLGTMFGINTDGSGFSLLHEFAGGVNDGSNPNDSLILDNQTFYGMTRSGGDADFGVIFRMVIPEPSVGVLLVLGLLGMAGGRRRRRACCC
jgi:uncharacterized repeat protein (TIGR03803 family)